MTTNEKRQAVADKYKTILGRNYYSQARRTYCFRKHANGNYYSDCSSSVALSYREAGYPIRDKSGYAIPNTVGMYNSPDLADVAATIQNGVVQNPGVLRVGDLLLFAGTDASRKSSGYVGHVEMIYKINGGKITICGHGSGRPRTTELNAYCKSRYRSKTSKTALGHKGLIKVRRRIQDDEATEQPTEDDNGGTEEKNVKKVEVTGATVNLRTGPGTQYAVAQVVKKGDVLDAVGTENGWVPVSVDGQLRWISEKYVKEA